MTAPSHIVLTEPSTVETLYPFSVLHCTWEVRCGALRLFEKVERLFPESTISFAGRDLHLRSFLARTGRTSTTPVGSTLVLDGSILPTPALRARIAEAVGSNRPVVFTTSRGPIGFFSPSPLPPPADAHTIAVEAQSITYLWDALSHNAGAIAHDAQFFSDTASALPEGVFCISQENIIIGSNVAIGPCTVIDASEGPVIIDSNARIMPHSTILGPCYIGGNAIIKVGAKIYGETSIGEWCKVGGEIENSIIHAYSNKQHDGFLGHSYLSEWVNLGADTNTSDLKNNYGTIRTRLRSEDIDTGRMFLGLLCGDHTKSGINTMFNTGTVTGISANIFGGDFPPKSIPSFSWGGHTDSPRFDIEKAVALARTVMARRKRTLLPEEEELLRREFDHFDLISSL